MHKEGKHYPNAILSAIIYYHDEIENLTPSLSLEAAVGYLAGDL